MFYLRLKSADFQSFKKKITPAMEAVYNMGAAGNCRIDRMKSGAMPHSSPGSAHQALLGFF